MAVVFISPKQRQGMFFAGITIVFLLILIIVFLVVFFSKPKEVEQALVFNKPKVDIDMRVFDSNQFKNLQEPEEMQLQYSYRAFDRNKKQQSGFLSAASEQAAIDMLTSRGLTVIEIEQVEIGRENPFLPYYQITPATK